LNDTWIDLNFRGGGALPTGLLAGDRRAVARAISRIEQGAPEAAALKAALAPHLEAAIKARFGELLADALERQKAALKQAAEAAVKEHGELLKAAGIAD
jgi:hypothetical protein